MWISSEAALAARAGGVRPVMLLRVESDPVARAWSGVGDFPLPPDEVETADDAIYKGIGDVIDWPPLDVLMNGEAGRLTFSMSGVSAVAQAVFEADLENLEGARVDLGLAFLDARWQLIAAPLWLVQAEIEDHLSAQERQGETMTRTVATTAAHGSLDRRRPLLAYWSPQDQSARSPGDRFCERTPIYNEGVVVSWPRFGSSS